MSKYSNKRITVDGITFDSLAEERRYRELRLLWRANELDELKVHPRYELEPKFTDASGKKHRAVTYIGDFEYIQNGQTVCEDVKGVETAVFRLKAELMARRYPHIALKIVRA
jgi:hypothetical protein